MSQEPLEDHLQAQLFVASTHPITESRLSVRNTDPPEPTDTVNAPKPIHCDPDGDREISAGPFGREQVFKVSSHAMSLASKPWKVMLGEGGAFLEASKVGGKPIHFYDDDPNALAVLLYAAHLQFAKVPLVMELPLLYNVAVLCNKYDTAELVQPWLDRSIAQIFKLYMTDAFVEKKLFIYLTFGREEMFTSLLRDVLKTLHYNEAEEYFRIKETGLKRFNENKLPPRVYEETIIAREATLNEALQACYALYDRLRSGQMEVCGFSGPCPRSTSAERGKCNTCICGSFAKALEMGMLLPDRKGFSTYQGSIGTLLATIKHLRVTPYWHPTEPLSDRCERAAHDMKLELLSQVERAFNSACCRLFAAFDRRLKVQAEKCPGLFG